MSQRERADRPASYPSSAPPKPYKQPTNYQKITSYDGGQGSSPRTAAPLLGTTQPNTTTDMYKILNSPEQPTAFSRVSRPMSQHPGEALSLKASPWREKYPAPVSQPLYASQSSSVPHVNPISGTKGGKPLMRASLSERNSPVAGYQQTLDGSRRAPSPQVSHSTSLHQSSLHSETGQYHQAVLGQTTGVKRPHGNDIPETLRRHQLTSTPSGNSISTVDGGTLPPRPLSQPINGPVRHTPTPRFPPNEVQDRPQALYNLPQMQSGHQHVVNAAGPHPHPSPRLGTPGGWPEPLHRPNIPSAVIGPEPQQAYIRLPGSDVPIPIQVDYSQASRKADEKRQRNAKASTRHRRKKKTIQEENIRQLQDVKEEREHIAQRLEDAVRQRDFYREERNRLRDIVSRTPGINHHANGPQSPRSTTSSMSYQERSPPHDGRQIGTPSQGYISESSSAERPVRRRRTNEHIEFALPQYGQSPAGLPPMQGSVHGGPTRPLSATSSGSVEKLPPLRGLEGAPLPRAPPPGQPYEVHTATAQWDAIKTRQYETGWATSVPRHGGDAHIR